ncbi:MAG: DUF3332 domain-containing protein [Culturomica sp.]|jgi:hypothetical protein|nr:DUF3332 domain-containing protein [Culturomica sp.]
MKKIFSKISTSIVVIVLSLSLSGCIGSFTLVNKVKDWNQELNGKFLQELVFLGLHIIPIYQLAVMGDLLIFNTIEFWSGENPLAMDENAVEESDFMYEGQQYKMIKKRNSLTLANGDLKISFKYFPEEEVWYLMDGSQKVKVAELKGNEVFTYMPNNETVVVDQNSINTLGMSLVSTNN